MQFIEEQSVGRVWSFRDITAHRRAEEAVRESIDRLRFMANAMPQKICTIRADGEVDYVNQQWTDYTGLPSERMMGWQWTQLIHPEDLDENIKRWRHALGTGEPFQMEHRIRQADGRYRWHLTRAQAKRDAHGDVSMWVASHTDIDGIKREDEEKKRLLENEREARAEAERGKPAQGRIPGDAVARTENATECDTGMVAAGAAGNHESGERAAGIGNN